MSTEGRRRSCVWDYYVKLDDTSAQCNKCQKKLSVKNSNTSNMITHLRRIHYAEFEEFSAKRHNKFDTITSSVENTSNMNLRIDESSYQEMEAASTSSKSISSTSVASNQTMLLGKRKKQRLNDAVANFITREMLPYDIVERSGFKDMLKEFQPDYMVPGRKAFTETIIPRLTHSLEIKIKNLFLETHFVALTTDCWTSITLQPFIAVTAHFLNNTNWSLTRVCLSCRKLEVDHSAENLKDAILDILEEWGLNNKIISGCTTDNGSNIVKCMQLLSWSHLSCFGHVLNIGVNRVYKMNCVTEPIKKARIIQNTIAHSWQLKRNLKLIQERMGIPQHTIPSVCETRWWSILKLLKIIVEQHTALIVLFSETRKHKYCNYPLTADEIKKLSTLVITLEPLEKICQHMCGEYYVTSSAIYPIYVTLMGQLNIIDSEMEANNSDDIDNVFSKQIKQDICQLLGEKYDKPVIKNIIQTATFLDPRFKLNYFPEEKYNLINRIKEEITKIQPQLLENTRLSSSTSSIHNLSELDKEKEQSNLKGLAAILKPERAACIKTFTEILDSEIDYYIQLPSIELERDPLFWWNDHLNVFPHIKYIAEIYLIIPGTSVPSERVFSCAGNIITDTRACLSAEHAEQLVFLSMNKHIC